MTKLYLVARIPYGKPLDPQVVSVDSQIDNDQSITAARKYEGAKPGTRLAVWMLGNHPGTFIVDEDGTTLHPGERL